MRIVEVNSFNFGSTGRIMLGIAEVAREKGYNVWTFNPAGKSQKKNITGNYSIGNRYERNISSKICYYIGGNGKFNIIGTKRFLSELDNIKPDIIHFHNLHSNYLNLEMLFHYIKKRRINVVWTLHDCWSFTGHCPYFDIVGCEKWKEECYACPMIHEYPATKWDSSTKEFRRKKELFTNIEDMTIVTPSQWLANLVSESFLKDYPVRVIFNGINLSNFHPRTSNFRARYKIAKDKFIILGVAFSWGTRKGQDRFELLAKKLDNRFQIVLVGIDEKNVNSDNIICIPKTDNQEQLAEIYTAADVFLNPTREDNFPTVNVEALSCGLPVISYGAGGSAEAFDEQSGMIADDENIADVLNRLYDKPIDRENCLLRGREFDERVKFQEYIELYEKITQ